MLTVGTYVSYRAEGVCVISDIRTESFGHVDGDEEYYILTPIRDANSLLYVPVGNEALVSKMLPLLSAEEICALAEKLKDERIEWKSESRARSYIFKDILNTGDRQTLIVLVNTFEEKAALNEQIGKKLTVGDENTFKRAKKMLLDEFSVTSDIDTEEKLVSVLRCQCKCASK